MLSKPLPLTRQASLPGKESPVGRAVRVASCDPPALSLAVMHEEREGGAGEALGAERGGKSRGQLAAPIYPTFVHGKPRGV